MIRIHKDNSCGNAVKEYVHGYLHTVRTRIHQLLLILRQTPKATKLIIGDLTYFWLLPKTVFRIQVLLSGSALFPQVQIRIDKKSRSEQSGSMKKRPKILSTSNRFFLKIYMYRVFNTLIEFGSGSRVLLSILRKIKKI